MMSPTLRKLVLTSHVISSVGWLGAVTVYLVFSIRGLISSDNLIIRTSYVAMDTIGWMVIVPFSFASLLSGLTNSLGSAWGVFRHYWVIFKLLIAVAATALLLLHMQPTSYVASAVQASTLSSTELHSVRVQLVGDAAAAILVLVIATVLSVYKPRGMTSYGWRKQQANRSPLNSRVSAA